MKIGVSSYSFSKYKEAVGCSYFELCDKAKETGFDGIEFIELADDNPLQLAHQLKEYCKKIGLDIIAYTIGADFMKEDIEAEVSRLCGCVDICEALGAKLMRHDVCYSLPENCSWEEAAERMAPHIRKVTEYADTKGIRTCTENHGYIFQAPERVEYLIKTVNCENYGWLCDMGNFLCADADPLDSVKIASGYAFHVHAKDFRFQEGGDCPEGYFGTTNKNWLCGTVLGHGIVPIKDCINLLKSNGYDGWFSLEFEGPEDCLSAIKEGYEFLKKNM